MDFSFTTEQDELRALAAQICADHTDIGRINEVLATDTVVDADLWRKLADAGLVGIGLPESAGGGGLGWLETAIVLEEIGRSAAMVPAFAVMALAGPALAESASGAAAELLADAVSGSAIVTAALHEPVGDVTVPTVAAVDGRITGTKVCVPDGMAAAAFVVTATDGLYLVRADADGVTRTRQDTTNDVPDAMVEFHDAPAERLGGVDASARVLQRGASAAAVMTSGGCQAALALTAEYTKSREQFERKIASFQAVSQRAGDAYIDTEAVRLTAWQAAWRLAQGLECDTHLLTAKFWAAEGGWRVMHAAHHLHGGFGVDRDYKLHRYFLNHKHLELQLGSATPSLQRLGRLLTT